MAKLNPYISFSGKTREALGFYKEIFGGEISLMTIADTPMAEQFPAEKQQEIMHGQLDAGGVVLMGSDMSGPEGVTQGNSVSLVLNCDSQEEIERLFQQLSTDGKAGMALSDTFWGAVYGSLIDKYGVYWSLNYQKA